MQIKVDIEVPDKMCQEYGEACNYFLRMARYCTIFDEEVYEQGDGSTIPCPECLKARAVAKKKLQETKK